MCIFYIYIFLYWFQTLFGSLESHHFTEIFFQMLKLKKCVFGHEVSDHCGAISSFTIHEIRQVNSRDSQRLILSPFDQNQPKRERVPTTGEHSKRRGQRRNQKKKGRWREEEYTRTLRKPLGKRRRKTVGSLLIENSSALAILIKGWKFSARSIG